MYEVLMIFAVFALYMYIYKRASKYLSYPMHFFQHLFGFFFLFYSTLLFSFFFVHCCYNMHHHTHQHRNLLLPCFYCHPQRYIRMVQSLIERCLLLHMSQDQCVKALAEHASITPLITLTVWKELQKENKDFFRAYFQVISPRPFMSRYFQRGPRIARRKQWK